MTAVVFHGVGDIRLDDVAEPRIEAPTDAHVPLTASAICGTDLHFVRGTVPGLKPGTIPGHEGVGRIVDLGREVGQFAAARCNLSCNRLGAGHVFAIDTVGVDAEPPTRGPAAKRVRKQQEQFRAERQKIAPKSKPDGDHWKPGEAPSLVLQWMVEGVAE